MKEMKILSEWGGSGLNVAESENALYERYTEKRMPSGDTATMRMNRRIVDVNSVRDGVHEHEDEDLKRISRELRDMVFGLVSDAATDAAGNTKKMQEKVQKNKNKNVISRKVRTVHAATRASLKGYALPKIGCERLNDT